MAKLESWLTIPPGTPRETREVLRYMSDAGFSRQQIIEVLKTLRDATHIPTDIMLSMMKTRMEKGFGTRDAVDIAKSMITGIHMHRPERK